MTLKALTIVAALVLTFSFVAGCSRSEEGEPEPEIQTEQPVEGDVPEDAEELPSAAARSRGLPTESDESGEPDIVLDELVYEWRTSPETGLHVSVDLMNPYETYERARGSLFIVAWSSASPDEMGVFPWETELEDGEPSDPSAGSRLLFRKDQRAKAFIPYKSREGCYDQLRVLVYDDDGNKIVDAHYSLDIHGEPTGPQKPKPVIAL